MKPDLNLLTVFEAVARNGSVTAAGDELRLSQPAVSHALNRLRALVGDSLFTRSRRGLVPTPLAVGMLEQVRDVLAGARALMVPAHFDHMCDAAHFRIGASDYAALTILPGLITTLRHVAPGVTLEILPVGPGVLNDLETGRLDLSFWGTAPAVAPFHYACLFEEHYIGLAFDGHPIFETENESCVTLDKFLTYAHLTVSLGAPGERAIDRALAALGRRRRVGVTSFTFAGNVATLLGSDFLGCLPSRLARDGPSLGLRQFVLPLLVPPYDYGFIWHPRTHTAPSHRWLRTVLKDLTST